MEINMNIKIVNAFPSNGKIGTIPPTKIINQSPNQLSIWDNCEYILTPDCTTCDYLVIMDTGTAPVTYSDTLLCPRNHTIFVTHDPESLKRYENSYLSQFGTVVTPHQYIQHPHIIRTHQILPWYINKTYDELVNLSPPTKTKVLSVITSNKRFTAGHEKRYEFVMAIKKRLEDKIDLFGRGICDFDDKWDVLSPYKYSIAIENSCSKDYITEKFTDCLLSYTYPYYYGCPNVEDYYPKDSFQYIDISDLEGTLTIIEKDLSDPEHYAKHLKAIVDARNRYLNEYQLYPALTNIINKIDDGNRVRISTTILPQKYDANFIKIRLNCLKYLIKNKLSNII